MCNTGSAPVPRRPTRDDIVGEDPWSNPIVDPAFAQDPTGIMRQSDVLAIGSINEALGLEGDAAIPSASQMLGGFGGSNSPGPMDLTGRPGAEERGFAEGRYTTQEQLTAAQTAKAEAAAEEKRRVAAWQGENRSRRGRASTLLTGPRGLSSDGTSARRTLLAM
jgi:hypothetical protein